ncbi:MAG: hypothetical protein JSW08_03350 [archaeon]|nr:MAG: hypothetical protein JSW08_03350 [archaeon]
MKTGRIILIIVIAIIVFWFAYVGIRIAISSTQCAGWNRNRDNCNIQCSIKSDCVKSACGCINKDESCSSAKWTFLGPVYYTYLRVDFNCSCVENKCVIQERDER